MRPADVLLAQMDFVSRMDDHRFRAMTATTYSLDQGLHVAKDEEHKRSIQANAEVLVDVLHSQVKTAYAYRVTEDMSLMVQHAAAGLDDLDRFDRSLAPTGAGLVRFDRPLPITDIRGRRLKVHWVVWGPAPTESGVGTMLTFFNDARDPDEAEADWAARGEAYTDIMGTLGNWRWVGSDLAFDDQRLGAAEVMPSGRTLDMIVAQGDVPTPTTTALRYIHALWLMLNQTIAAVEPEDVPRQTRRKAERMRIPSQVTVIRMRRQEYANRADGESLIEWNHRWVVRGHWAWRKCGPSLPGAVPYQGGHRRRIFVPPYVKGPDGKPLVVTDKVYQLER